MLMRTPIVDRERPAVKAGKSALWIAAGLMLAAAIIYLNVRVGIQTDII